MKHCIIVCSGFGQWRNFCVCLLFFFRCDRWTLVQNGKKHALRCWHQDAFVNTETSLYSNYKCADVSSSQIQYVWPVVTWGRKVKQKGPGNRSNITQQLFIARSDSGKQSGTWDETKERELWWDRFKSQWELLVPRLRDATSLHHLFCCQRTSNAKRKWNMAAIALHCLDFCLILCHNSPWLDWQVESSKPVPSSCSGIQDESAFVALSKLVGLNLEFALCCFLLMLLFV